MMKKTVFVFLALISFMGVISSFAGAEEEGKASGRVLVIREGKQIRKDIVAVEATILDGVMDVKIEARM